MFSSTTSRRCGMPINAVRSHAQSLELMRYMVKTVYGVSEKSYTGTPFAPLFGTGQGSGASPAVWLTLVVILLNTLERVSPLRMSFRSSDGVNMHSRLVDAFVDDTALGFTDNGSLSFDELVTRLEDLAQTWEKRLHYSGSSLNLLSKCSWFVMYWDWRSGRPILREQTIDPLATVRLSQGQDPNRVVIRRQPLNQATRILGIYQNPIGDFSHHVSILKKKADEYASRIQTPRLTSSDIRVFVRTTYEPAMRYSLPTLVIDEEELEQIQTRILPTIVQKLGMNRNLPTAVRHGPLSMGGLGLMDLCTECGIEMVKYFRHHIYRRTEVGELLVIQLKTLQLEAGILPHLLEHPTIVLDYLTPTWILSLRQFLSNHNMAIHVTDVQRVDLKGKQDTTIMDSDRLSRYSRVQQRDVNLVRLYLQCFKLSDLCCSHDHSKISQHLLGGDRPPHFETIPGWPRQERPSAHQRRLWSRYISSNYLRYGDLWKRRPIDNLQEIKPNIRLQEETADLSTNSTGIQMKTLPPYQRRLLSSVRLCVSEAQVWEASRSKKNLTIASDGGLKDVRGTFGWTLSTSENIILYEGSGPVDGPRDVANSTRCEIAGLAAPLLLLSLLVHQWGTKLQGKLRWVCDSKAAISKVEKHTSVHKSSRKQPTNADLLAQIRSYRTSLRSQLLPTWIKGHQSTKNSSKDVIQNNRADELATEYRNGTTRRQSRERTDHIPESRVSIWIQGIQQVGQVEACIRFHINGYHLRQHLQARHKWTDEEWNTIDLQLLSQFCRSLTPSKHTAQVKFMNNQRHTGLRRYQVAKIKDPTMRLCPCCLRVEEDDDHVLQCIENPGRETALRLFRRAIDATSLLPSVKALKQMLLNWLENTDTHMDMREYPSIHQSSIVEAVAQQSRIGWSAAMRGFFTVEWRYLASVPAGDKEEVLQAKGLQTMRKIIRATHDCSMLMWKARNQKLHGTESQGMRGLRCPELFEITHLHAHPELLVSAGDRHFCERPLGDLLRASHSVRRRWLLYMRNARERYKHEDGKTQTAITKVFRRL
ncbi:hypothetical protein MHU86_4827 [Fragilaria crotonensis]|nr:hypothetical protein MHU86_4827 [Fragilaria crotonensis]